MASLPPSGGASGPRRGLIRPGNIDLFNRPNVSNPETGGMSSVWSMSVGTDQGTVLIPRIADDGAILTPDQAIEQFQKTGRHLGLFEDQYAADHFAQQLHEQQEDIAGQNFMTGTLGYLAGVKKKRE